MAKFDAAISLERNVGIYYTDATDCAALPASDASPAPYYVMLH
jgi:hypothetical protein